ncbi:phosphoesterase-domain-containing protein [Rhizopus microsporus var. microsporus]|uniref:Phosphoesterase-domain-containing protein n=2 Tax=Rhizopus microsporus TaxID=58291 RepID=A0A2G4SRC2_RHIZD|nr:phosphoesterase-domain-containing protein [Rhizopus microsporus ATCC 52813]ORE06439.1 phosphoesterase-domain-containing protein [Rhizopus microsporus var. microsporus]PHZ11311.1 phosphoesterase-domain-containing protein [Rhizopus microsporus ATCC 52813]
MKLAAGCCFLIAAVVGVCNAAPAKGKVFDHFLQIWFENQDFDVVAKTPGFTNLQKYGILLNNYNALTHPSQPNYVAAAGGTNYGITDDKSKNIPANVKTIFDLLENAGLTWKLYQEDIPSVGWTGTRSGLYVRKHNPAVSYASINKNSTRLQNIVPATQFAKDIANKNLPNWMFYTPNLDNDGHDTDAATAGKWLTEFFKNTLNDPYVLENVLILITFDETDSYSIRNKVWSLLLGAVPDNLKGTTDSTFYSHYSTLSTVEQNWDLGDLNQQDTNKKMANVFKYVADQIGYQNVDVPPSQIPKGNTKLN